MDGTPYNLLICEDAESAAREAAERFACAAVRAVAKRGAFHVAVPGGSSPRGMFHYLASRDFQQLVPWSPTELFFTDERCVPPESDESNYRLVSESLLSEVAIAEDSIHRMRGEDTPEQAALDYESELHRAMGPSPCFDLIVLGMGVDTHTASLFPNSNAVLETGKHVVADYVEKLGAYRLTMTLPLINNAEQVMILVHGADKAASLAEVMQGPRDSCLHPVQGVRPISGRLLWIVDRAAASLL